MISSATPFGGFYWTTFGAGFGYGWRCGNVGAWGGWVAGAMFGGFSGFSFGTSFGGFLLSFGTSFFPHYYGGSSLWSMGGYDALLAALDAGYRAAQWRSAGGTSPISNNRAPERVSWTARHSDTTDDAAEIAAAAKREVERPKAEEPKKVIMHGTHKKDENKDEKKDAQPTPPAPIVTPPSS